MDAICSIILASLIMSAMMMTAWAVQKPTKQSGWADVFWSYAIGIGGLIVALMTRGDAPVQRSWLVAAMVGASAILYTIRLTLTALPGRHGRLRRSPLRRSEARPR